jgi:ATP-binding cassette subfamily F protein 3
MVEVPGFEVSAGDRIAIIGANGSGKTTLLKTLVGELAPVDGSIGYGARVMSSYYDQHLGDLPEDRTLVEVLQAAQALTEESARGHLARLLFRGDDVFKKVRQLSGGERSRLALARLMLDRGNLLFLDEPTNHLDVPSQEVLQEALQEYTGTIVFVSHDRELIDALATHSWWLEPPADPASHLLARVKIEEGGYRAHMRIAMAPVQVRLPARGAAPAESAVNAAATPAARTPAARKQSRAEAAEERRARAAAAKRVAAMEKEIAAAEERKAEIEARLSDPDLYRFPMEAEILGRELKEIAARLPELYATWEAAAAGQPEAAGTPAG